MNGKTFAASVFSAVAAIVLALSGPAGAEGIKPGLWKVISRTATGGVIGPPHKSSKCLSAADVQDLATTFSPVSSAVNSACAPIERNLTGTKLTWKLVCKGKLDMELDGEFNFDSPRHYNGIVQTKAAMMGMRMVDSRNTLEGHWVSECR